MEQNGASILCILVIAIVVLTPFIILIAIAYNAGQAAKKLKEQREKAWQDYSGTLAQLKMNPTNPDLKETVLYYGRVYSNLSRNKQGVTIFDEVALANDINAACAGASGPLHTNSQPLSAEARLSSLRNLFDQGHISQQEYDQQRQKILSEL